ncbi:MAG: reverse transcriptase domain-containing protein [Candidatus Thiodiazotropha sp.]
MYYQTENPAFIEQTQNPLQRGFTKGSSPMNSSMILEEYIRESKDLKKDVYIAFLDAKSAFDVVDHASLMRRLFQIGIDGGLWNLIYSLHTNAQTVVRWVGQTTESFSIQQGVRQGGILSTDMYKIYLNPQLNRLSESGKGGTIGEIDCSAPTAADDIAAVTDEAPSLQSLVSISDDFSRMERYLLQPEKSVVMAIPGAKKPKEMQGNEKWNIYEKEMPIVTEAMHMGLRRSSVSEEVTISENITKSRRSFYSLMSADLQGMDPETAIQLYQTYVLPVLNYGLEVVLPKQKYLDILERQHRKFMKHILALPVNTADAAIYILSGTIPIEGYIHKRALSLYGNICRLDQTSIEWRLAERQLSTKTDKSNSWFIAVKKIFVKYGLNDPSEMLFEPIAKLTWKRILNQHVNQYWVDKIKFESTLYPSLRFLSSSTYTVGKRHSLLQNVRNQQEIPRIRLKLKVVTGTYILQVNRSSFNQNRIDPTCLMCGDGDETIEHFILDCVALSHIRVPILKEIRDICNKSYPVSDSKMLLQIILDSHLILNVDTKTETAIMLEYQCRRLCFSLHCERYKILGLIPNRKRRKL